MDHCSSFDVIKYLENLTLIVSAFARVLDFAMITEKVIEAIQLKLFWKKHTISNRTNLFFLVSLFLIFWKQFISEVYSAWIWCSSLLLCDIFLYKMKLKCILPVPPSFHSPFVIYNYSVGCWYPPCNPYFIGPASCMRSSHVKNGNNFCSLGF